MEEKKIDCVNDYKDITHSYLIVRIMDVDNFEIYSFHGELIEKLHDVADYFYILYLVSIGGNIHERKYHYELCKENSRLMK